MRYLNSNHNLLFYSILSLIGGSLFGVSIPEGNALDLFFGLLGTVVLIFLLEKRKMTLLNFFTMSFGFSLFGINWLYHDIKTFSNVDPFFGNVIAYFFIMLFVTQFFATGIGLKLFDRFLPRSKSSTILVPVLLTFFEYLPKLFPYQLGTNFIYFKPYVFFGSVFGVEFYSFILYLLASLVSGTIQRQFRVKAFFTFLVLMVLNFSFPVQWDSGTNLSKKFGLIQRDNFTAQGKKLEEFDDQTRNSYLEEYLKMSKDLLSKTDFDVLVWPEGSVQGRIYMNDLEPFLFKKLEELKLHGNGKLQAVVFQMPLSKKSVDFQYNSVSILYDLKNKNYDIHYKTSLIPFAEDTNFLTFIPGEFVKNSHNLLVSKKGGVHRLDSNFIIQPLICYEAVFSTTTKFVVDLENYPNVFVNHASDSLFTGNEPYQHFYMTAWRAIEYGIPLLRSNESGISGAVFPNGELSNLTQFKKPGLVKVEVPVIKTEPTIFARYGRIPLILVLALLAILDLFVGTNKKLADSYSKSRGSQ